MRIYGLLLTFSLLSACVSTDEVQVNNGTEQSTSSTNVVADKEVIQGMSIARLERIDEVMQDYVSSNKLAGTLTLVSRNNEIVHLSAHGMRDKANNLEMTEDTIFRIYSMTKPITAVAALTLWEQGKFHMQDPVDMYLPELKDLKVYVSGSGDDMVLEDAKHPIRIIDLFMHTAGFSYGFTNSEVDKLYRASPVALGKQVDADNVLSELAKLPLNHQPGTQYHYGLNTDVIGFLLERITGKKLGKYMQEVIFDPLGMDDTGFFVKPENIKRFAEVYGPDQQGNTIVVENEPLGDFLSDPVIHNGGGGLTSTISDYHTFASMLLNGGTYNGVRVLGRKTVEYMASNHLPPHLLPYETRAPGEGHGLAVSVTVDQDQVLFMGSTGDFGWGGAASTFFRIDPEEKIILIAMTQFLPYGFHRYMDDHRNLVYQALVD